MPAAAFLALLAIALLLLSALRLELNFRRASEETSEPEPRSSRPGRRNPRPELRAAPAGGYWQAPIPPTAFRKS